MNIWVLAFYIPRLLERKHFTRGTSAGSGLHHQYHHRHRHLTQESLVTIPAVLYFLLFHYPACYTRILAFLIVSVFNSLTLEEAEEHTYEYTPCNQLQPRNKQRQAMVYPIPRPKEGAYWIQTIQEVQWPSLRRRS